MPPDAIRSITRYRPSRVVSSERAREAAIGRPALVVRDVVETPFFAGTFWGAARPERHCMGRGGRTHARQAGRRGDRELPGCLPAHRGGRRRRGDGPPPPRVLEPPREGEGRARTLRALGGRRRPDRPQGLRAGGPAAVP